MRARPLVLVVLVACGRPTPAPSPNPSKPADATSLASASTSASTSPAGFPPGAREVHAWSDGTRIGLASMPSGDDGVHALGPKDAKPTLVGTLSGKATATAWLDVDGDDSPELVVWAEGDPSVYGQRKGRVASLRRIEELLRGATTVAAVTARRPFLRGYVAPAAGVSARDVLLSLRFATDDQVRALVGPGGVSFCTIRVGNAKPHKNVCRTVLPAKLTRKDLDEELRGRNAIEDYEGEPYEVPGVQGGGWGVNAPTCKATSVGAACTANMGGPGNWDWDFTGVGAALRLVKISDVVYEST